MTDLFGEDPIRALSWKEPFASLMFHGKIETRTWPTTYRGLVLICCTQYAFTRANVVAMSGEKQYERIKKALGCDYYTHTQFHGRAIGVGRLVDCRKMTEADEDACFLNYRTDLYCHVYKEVKRIKPFVFKGAQGWKHLDKKTIKMIQDL
jgi:hypothetical protein